MFGGRRKRDIRKIQSAMSRTDTSSISGYSAGYRGDTYNNPHPQGSALWQNYHTGYMKGKSDSEESSGESGGALVD